jgi:hypothetical protein
MRMIADAPCGNSDVASITISVNRSSPQFRLVQGGPTVSVNDAGDLDFTKEPGEVAVIIQMQDPRYIFLDNGGKKGIGFGDNYDSGHFPKDAKPVDANHYMIKHPNVSKDGETLTFCYVNRADPSAQYYRFASYVLYVAEPSDPHVQVREIDPRIGNGSFVPPP